jgi:hypothetical protein
MGRNGSVAVYPRKELLRMIQQLGAKYSTWNVFEDFLAMSSISFSNAVDWAHREEREAQYMEIVGRYEKAELDLFPQMLAYLVEEMERYAEDPTDVLGAIFHELELHNKYKGQFFTPQNVSDMMGAMTISEDDKSIAENGYINLCEPCAGSGAMILGFAKAMKKYGHDFNRQLVVSATDVDLKCVYMTYLQLSLYGIPAVVIHGNSLSLQEWSRWYTPVYMLDGWIWRQACGNLDKRYPEDEAMKRVSDPLYAAIRKTEELISGSTPPGPPADPLPPAPDIALKECKNGQLSFI